MKERRTNEPCETAEMTENQFSAEMQRSLRQKLLRARDFLIPPPGGAYLNSWQKRTVDLIGAILVTPVLVPPILLATAAIKIEDGGDIFFIQQRKGKNGKDFGLYKLRTMAPAADRTEETFTFPKLPENPRVTKVGKLLRRWCIDEIPQIINILKGEMSLMGVRPLPTEQFETQGKLANVQDLSEQWSQAYTLCRPGWTSLTSVRGRALLDTDEQGIRKKLRYDQFYISHASPCFDLWILKEGIKAFFSGKGAW